MNKQKNTSPVLQVKCIFSLTKIQIYCILCTVLFYLKSMYIFSQKVLDLVLSIVCVPYVPTCGEILFCMGDNCNIITTFILLMEIIETLWYTFCKIPSKWCSY